MSDARPNTAPQNDSNPVVDGRFRLKVANDKLAVHMEGLQPPSGGGKPIEIKQLHAQLKKLGVVYGINNKKIEAIITALNEGHPPPPEEDKTNNKATVDAGTEKTAPLDNNSYCIVQGEPPVHGQDAALLWNISESETAGYVATPGELIATHIPSTPGTPGKTIFGKPVNAHPGRDDTIKPGDGIEQTISADTSEYRAQWFGTLHIDANTLSIDCPVQITADHMRATLDLHPPGDSQKTLTIAHVLTGLQHHNITHGINETALAAALVTVNESRQPVENITVAEGTPVIQGVDASIKWHIDKNSVTAGNYIIRPGDLIATQGLSLTGTAGTDIFGVPLPVAPEHELPLEIGDNVSADEDSHECHAEVVGILTYSCDANGNRLSIDPCLQVAADAMAARLDIFKKYSDGRNVNSTDIIRSLKTCGITAGIDEEAIKHALESDPPNSTGPIKGLLVARGKPARDGEDGFITYTQKTTAGGQEVGKGRVDVHEHNTMWSFKKDDVVGQVFNARAEEDGFNVRGEILKATPANEMNLELEGAHINPHNKIIADVDGTLIIDGLHLSIADLSVIEGDISQKTGNIHSTNNVHIKGHVSPGFTVESDKNITIDQNVEDACVRAGGNITIKGGIRGSKSEVYTPNDISVQFVENADVYVNGNVTINGSILNSNVSSNNSISVGTKQAKNSAIIGGRTTAHTRIEAFSLGSSAYRKTVLSVGFTQETKQQQRDLRNDIAAKENDLLDLEQIRSRCESHNIANAKEILYKVSTAKESLTAEVAALKEKLNQLMEEIKKAENVAIIVRKKVFPGVTIKINDHTYLVDREMSSGTFTLEDDEIVFKPGNP